MKTSHLIIGGAVLAVGVFFAWKYKAKLTSIVSPDPTVTSLAMSTYQGSQDVPGTIWNAAGSASSTPGSYDPTSDSPGANAALNGALDGSGTGLNLSTYDA